MTDSKPAAPPLLYKVEDGVAQITLNRPDVLNALDHALLSSLAERVLEATTDGHVRALLITGAGRAFSAGGDVKSMMAGGNFGNSAARTPAGGALLGAGLLHETIVGLARMPKPVICAINGTAAGAGVGIALAGDIAWAARSASFKLAYTAIGLSPDGGTTYHLTRAVGPKLAAELFLTNRVVDSNEALRTGLVSRVLDDDALLPECLALARRLAAGPTRAYGELKALVGRSLRQGLETQLEDERRGVARSVMTRDFMEGVMAFVQKRDAEFSGE